MDFVVKNKQAFQDLADIFGVEVKTYIDDDKHQTQRYFLRKGSLSVSPSLTEREMSNFLSGMCSCKKHNL